jgi:hypothetical protein
VTDQRIREFPCHLCRGVILAKFGSRKAAEQLARAFGWHQLLGRWYCPDCWNWPNRGTSS